MNRPLLLIILLLFLTLALVALSYGKNTLQKTTSQSQPTVKPTATVLPKKQVALSLTPQATSSAVGQTLTLSLNIKAEPITLSAIAIRLTYPFTNQPPLKPQTAQFIANPSLVQAGFAFPVNKITVDDKSKMVVAELAGVNLTPQGFPLSKEETIATVSFDAVLKNQNITVSFDKAQTTITTKDGIDVNLTLQNGTYNIK